MTYEKFVKTIESQDENKNRKSIRTFVWKFFVSFFSYAFILCVFSGVELPTMVAPLVAIAFMVLGVFMLDWFAEDMNVLNKAEKFSKFWWLHLIVAIIGSTAIILFLK